VEAACGQRPGLPDWLGALNERSERVTVLPNDQATVERFVLAASRAAQAGVMA
jgi:threonine synthase